VNIAYRSQIEAASDKEEARRRLIEEYRARFANPYRAAELGFVDEVIRPRDVRKRLAVYLSLLKNKRDKNPPRKHGNIPL
jgi:propionyl-CoA carboxylase beta chain